jgi:cyclase
MASDEKPMPIREIKLTDSLRRIILPKEDTSLVTLTGPDGILLVDNGAKESMPELKNKLEALKSGPVRYIILTHWHPDHVQGVHLIGKETTVMAHSHTREMLAHDQVLTGLPPIKAQSEDKLPRITIDSKTTLCFDGEIIEIMPLPGGHSGGDMAVYFKNANILDIGDLIQSDIFPFCDIDHGGNLVTLAENIAKVIATMPPNVRIIPAHGREYTLDDLKKYKGMIEGVIVRAEMRKGKSFDEMKATDVLKDYKAWATQWGTCNDMIDYAYKSLK